MPINNGLMGHFRSFFAVRPRTLAFNFIAEGDYVVVEARGDNVTKAGERYDNHYCMVWRIENGKIKEIKEYCDLRAGRSACSGRSRLASESSAVGGVRDAQGHALRRVGKAAVTASRPALMSGSARTCWTCSSIDKKWWARALCAPLPTLRIPGLGRLRPPSPSDA